MKRTAKFVCVSTENNNKYYTVYEQDDGSVKVEYGRVGMPSVSKKDYPIGSFEKICKQRIAHGYTDQTHLFAVSEPKKEVATISNKYVKTLIDTLLRFANKSISENYLVTSASVTRKQIDAAQVQLDALVTSIDKKIKIDDFNQMLTDLFRIIPRKMKKVQEFLAEEKTKYAEILDREQSILDTMAGQVQDDEPISAEEQAKQVDILTQLGLIVDVVEDKEIDLIRKLMGENKNQFANAHKVVNQHTTREYEKSLKEFQNPKLFWHGSRNENWFNIMKTGLLIRPSNAILTGSMFGNACYFADKCRKSIGYTSIHNSYWARGSANQAFLALYDVNLGKPMHLKHHEGWMSSLTWDKLRQKGDYHSVFAEGGADLRNNEFMVYKTNQCTIKYLVEITG